MTRFPCPTASRSIGAAAAVCLALFAYRGGPPLAAQDDVCVALITPTFAIQGGGSESPLVGRTVVTRGVVVGDYEGATPALGGFYIQDRAGDGDVATSDGLFVFNGARDEVRPGDLVAVSGEVSEYQGQTQVAARAVSRCGSGTVAPAALMLPFSSSAALERVEGMLVRLPQQLSVTDHSQLGRFGQVVLSSGGRLVQPTEVVTPGPAAEARRAANDRNRLLLDDGSNVQNPDPILFGRGGRPLSAANPLRAGDTATGIVGVLTYTWGGHAASPNAYRVRPVAALGGIARFEPTNARPVPPPPPEDMLRVVSLNLLNFFNTFQGCRGGVGGVPTECRGAGSPSEFARQWPKTVDAILGSGADVVALLELENDGYGPDSALAYLVERLNAATSPGTFAHVDVDAATGQVNALGTDAIRVGLLYKPGRARVVGAPAVLATPAFVTGGDRAPRNRPALAVAIEAVEGAERLVVSVSHLKSKGGACDEADAGDGQGECAVVRTRAAELLAAWLASDPTGTSDPDVLIVGDLNAYAKEAPIQALVAAGYVDLSPAFGGGPSFGFDGQWGALDHAMASRTLRPQVARARDWPINADEPPVLDYQTRFKSAGQQASLYAPDRFRMSDHNALRVDLALQPVTRVRAARPTAKPSRPTVKPPRTGKPRTTRPRRSLRKSLKF